MNESIDSCGGIIGEVIEERMRQISAEGFDHNHDDEHTDKSLSIAAACYAVYGTSARVIDPAESNGAPRILEAFSGYDGFPWEEEFDKRDKHPRRRRLIIAMALLLAEAEREDRSNEG